MTSFVIADTACCCCCCCFGLTNHSEAASLWLVKQDRATIYSGSPPSSGANFCSDRWLHRPRWVGWPVRPLWVWDYATKSNSCCHLASHFEYTHLASPVPGHYDIASTKPETSKVSQRCRKGSSHVPICTEDLVKYGLAVPVICAQTDTHTDRQTRSLQYFASHWGGVIRIKHDSNWVLPPRA